MNKNHQEPSGANTHLEILATLASGQFSSATRRNLITAKFSQKPARAYVEWAKKELGLLEARGGRVFSFFDNEYPGQLKTLHDPPALVFVLGKLPDRELIAVVGARKCSGYAEVVAAQIARELVDTKYGLISGLAKGVDEAAHRGYTKEQVAVLGSGFNKIYPASNKALAAEIVKSGGAVISEYPPSQPGHPYHFPARNRIIAALSEKVIVVEAKIKSGSLITANLALDLGKEVLSVPGPITSELCSGTNKLIADGAVPYLSIDSVSGFGNKQEKLKIPENTFAGSDKQTQAVASVIADRGLLNFDDLCELKIATPQKLRSILVHLELMGLVKTTKQDFIIAL